MLSADAAITVPSGVYDLRTRRGRRVLLLQDREVSTGLVGQPFTGDFDSFRLDTAISGWTVAGLDGKHRLDAFRNGEFIDIEAEPDANVSQLPLLILFGHWVWQSSNDEAAKWSGGG